MSKIHKILLLSIALEAKLRQDNKQAYFLDSYERAKTLANNLGLPGFPPQIECHLLLHQLETLNLLSTKEKTWIRKQYQSTQKSFAGKSLGTSLKMEVEGASEEERQKQVSQRLDPNLKTYYNISDTQIALNVEVDDITNALKDDESL